MADFVYEDVTETYAGKILDVENLNRMGLRGRSFYRSPPGMVRYNYHMDENVWRNLAATFSDEVEELGGFPIDTFGMLGELGYSTVKVFNDSLNQDFWGPPPRAPPYFTTCSVCLEGFLYDDNHFHEVLNLPCFHMFHKKCIFKWLWNFDAFRSEITGFTDPVPCPLCREFV
ncbi:unnamed protein product [Cochlearia groenlandica]